MKQIPSITVYFGTTDHLVSKIIRWAGWSWCSHVAIGDEDVVADLMMDYGSRFWPLVVYIARGKGRKQKGYALGRRYPLDLARFEDMPKPSWFRVCLRYLTLGVIGYRGDCVGLVKDALRDLHIEVPARVTTPGALERWMRREGLIRG